MRRHIQERVRSDGPVARIGNGGTDEPDRAFVSSINCLLAFRAATIGLKLVVEFMGGQDDGSSIQILAILCGYVRE